MNATHPIRCVARLAIRTAVRSRACAWLFAATLGATFGLPFLLRGDGTAIGHMRMVITYPIGMLFTVLLLGTLWLSAGLVSLEISGRQLQSVAVKPIRAFDIWAGKWLGLLAINACLVALATLGIVVSARTIAHRYAQDPDSHAALQEQLFVGRRGIAPEVTPDLIDEAEQLRWALIAEGRIPEGVPVARFVQEAKAKRWIVAPGATASWNLAFPDAWRTERQPPKLSLRYHFRCNPAERAPVSGSWTLAAEGCVPVRVAVQEILDGVHHLSIPDTFRPTTKTVTVSFSSTSTADTPHVFFDADAPVTLLVHAGSFTMNLLRSMFALLCFLAAVAAVGLTMGTLFSFPVAVFAGAAILFALSLATGFSEEPVGHSHGDEAKPSVITRMAEPALLTLKHATINVIDNIPIAALGDGMLFSWRQTGECALLLLLLLPAILGSISALLLSQKELAA